MPEPSNFQNHDPPRARARAFDDDAHARDRGGPPALRLTHDASSELDAGSRCDHSSGTRDHSTVGRDRTGGRSRTSRRTSCSVSIEAPPASAGANWTPDRGWRMMLTEIMRLHPLGDLAATRSPVSPASLSVRSIASSGQFFDAPDSQRLTRFTQSSLPQTPSSECYYDR